MIILITGASHTGKTALAQKLLEKCKYPYLSIDHLKMGLIRSGHTALTPMSDDEDLTVYLWPIVCEMMKTAIENEQNLIVEGCYIPFDWEKDFDKEYLDHISYYCLILSEQYIKNHFYDIKQYANVIEKRLDDEWCTLETVLKDNADMLIRAQKYNVNYILIDDKYEINMDLLLAPSSIKTWIDKKIYTVDDIGMSGNQVLIFEDMVLKIGKCSAAVVEQVQILQWLEGKLPVPKVLVYEEENGKSYLLMSRIEGNMSCDTYYLDHPDMLLEALASGLKMLWEVEIRDCPRIRDLDHVLREARIQVENHLVDLDNVNPDTFAEGGFESPEHLLEWLENNRPVIEPVFSHGDYCLPNVFLKNGQINGFIDLDRAGICDKWNDIALCYRSLKYNFDGTYGGKVYEDFDPNRLFEKLEIKPDWDKINYYILLDELF